jgi:hypothetical protein
MLIKNIAAALNFINEKISCFLLEHFLLLSFLVFLWRNHISFTSTREQAEGAKRTIFLLFIFVAKRTVWKVFFLLAFLTSSLSTQHEGASAVGMNE